MKENLVKLKILLSKTLYKLAEISTDKGSLIVPDDAELAVGLEVYILDENGDQLPAPDGDYALENGTIIKVVESKISEIVEVVEEQKEEKVEEVLETEVVVETEVLETEEVKTLKARVAELEEKLKLSTESNLENVNKAIALSNELDELKTKTFPKPLKEVFENKETKVINYASKDAQKISKRFNK